MVTLPVLSIAAAALSVPLLMAAIGFAPRDLFGPVRWLSPGFAGSPMAPPRSDARVHVPPSQPGGRGRRGGRRGTGAPAQSQAGRPG